MGFLEMLIIGFSLALMLGICLAFIAWMVMLKRREDQVIKKSGRLTNEEASHGIV